MQLQVFTLLINLQIIFLNNCLVNEISKKCEKCHLQIVSFIQTTAQSQRLFVYYDKEKQ